MATTLIPILLPTFNTPANCSVSPQTWETLVLFYRLWKQAHFRTGTTAPRFLFLIDCKMFFHREEFNQGNGSSSLLPRFYHPLSFPTALSKAKLVLVMSLARCSHLRGKQHSGCCKIWTAVGIPAESLIPALLLIRAFFTLQILP